MFKKDRKIYLNLTSKGDRFRDVDLIEKAISRCGAYIDQFSKFSDLAMGLTIEIEEKDIARLYEDLKTLVHIAEPLPENLSTDSEKEWLILMHISFVRGSGDVALDVPMVPG